jgi:3-oxoacyl-[acyl-carrier-protein] synthase II
MVRDVSRAACVITGAGLQVPGLRARLDLFEGPPEENAPFEPKAILGRKGLFGKDRATLLALCAAKVALERANWPADGLDPARIGVVVSSNFGNLDTVDRVLRAIKRGGSADASMMDAPNASSNVISSTLAIRFGCRGPNYTVCSGGTASLDALRAAWLTLAAGRADAMIVVGVEPRNPVVKALVEPWLGEAGCRAGSEKLAEGAAALIVERETAAAARGAQGLFRVSAPRRFRTDHGTPAAVADWPAELSGALRLLTFGRSGVAAASVLGAAHGGLPHTEQVMDIEDRLGACHGLQAILQAVLACALLGAREAARSAHVLLHAGAPYETQWAAAILQPLRAEAE